MTDHREMAGMCVGMESDDQLKVALLGIRTSLFAHIVAGRFAEVQSTDGDLAHLPVLQIDPVKEAARNE